MNRWPGLRVVAAAGLALVFLSSWALGRVVSYEEVRAGLFGSIQDLRVCGDWNIDGQFGEFRVVRLFYAGQDMLFVDMVTPSEGGSLLIVAHGFTFPEINNDHAEVGLSSVVCRSDGENRIKIRAEAVNGHNGRPYNFTLTVDGVTRSYEYVEY